MRSIIIVCSSLVAVLVLNPALAETKIVKRCRYSATPLAGEFKDKTLHTTVTGLETDGELYGVITTRTTDGEVIQNEIMTPLNIDVFPVRAGLDKFRLEDEQIVSTLNLGEKLVLHAMSVEAEPELKKYFSSGVKLPNVRQVRLLVFGDMVGIGMSALIEAYDKNQKPMGSFVGGLLVVPCQ